MRAGPAQRQIFICYRRDDTGAYAGRLNDVLCNDFDEDNVFFDRGGGIDGGDDWRQVIDDRLESCAALIVLIGPNWRPARLADPEDIVRREISSALAHGVRVIPVLVNDATLPSAADLPEEIRPLLGRQMMEMTDRHWRADYEQLAKSIRKEIARRKKKMSALFTRRSALAALALVLVLGLGLYIATKNWKTDDGSTRTDTTTSTAPPTSTGKTDVDSIPTDTTTGSTAQPTATGTIDDGVMDKPKPSPSPSPPPPELPTGEPAGVDVGYMKDGWSNPVVRNLSFAFVDIDTPELKRIWREMRARNLICGAYHVLYDLRDPIGQAERFVQTANPWEHDVLLGVNVSPLQRQNQPNKDLSADLHRYLDRFEQLTGKRPFIYVTTDSWNANFDDTFGSYPLWLTKSEHLPRGWSRVSLEQEVEFKDRGATTKYTFIGTLDELKAHAKKISR